MYSQCARQCLTVNGKCYCTNYIHDSDCNQVLDVGLATENVKVRSLEKWQCICHVAMSGDVFLGTASFEYKITLSFFGPHCKSIGWCLQQQHHAAPGQGWINCNFSLWWRKWLCRFYHRKAMEWVVTNALSCLKWTCLEWALPIGPVFVRWWRLCKRGLFLS